MSVSISFILSRAQFKDRRSKHHFFIFIGDMSVEELLEKYRGAYASDFEVPSASGSKASSDSELSGEEEEETEEDESDAESNTSSSGINQLPGTQNNPTLKCFSCSHRQPVTFSFSLLFKGCLPLMFTRFPLSQILQETAQKMTVRRM